MCLDKAREFNFRLCEGGERERERGGGGLREGEGKVERVSEREGDDIQTVREREEDICKGCMCYIGWRVHFVQCT